MCKRKAKYNLNNKDKCIIFKRAHKSSQVNANTLYNHFQHMPATHTENSLSNWYYSDSADGITNLVLDCPFMTDEIIEKYLKWKSLRFCHSWCTIENSGISCKIINMLTFIYTNVKYCIQWTNTMSYT